MILDTSMKLPGPGIAIFSYACEQNLPIGEKWDYLTAMYEQQWNGVRAFTFLVHEVNCERLITFTLYYSGVLWQFVKLRFRSSPVELVCPVFTDFLHFRQRRSVVPVSVFKLVHRKLGMSQSLLQVFDLRIRNGDLERYHFGSRHPEVFAHSIPGQGLKKDGAKARAISDHELCLPDRKKESIQGAAFLMGV